MSRLPLFLALLLLAAVTPAAASHVVVDDGVFWADLGFDNLNVSCDGVERVLDTAPVRKCPTCTLEHDGGWIYRALVEAVSSAPNYYAYVDAISMTTLEPRVLAWTGYRDSARGNGSVNIMSHAPRLYAERVRIIAVCWGGASMKISAQFWWARTPTP